MALPYTMNITCPRGLWARINAATTFYNTDLFERRHKRTIDEPVRVFYSRVIDAKVFCARTDDPFGQVSGDYSRIKGLLCVQESGLQIHKDSPPMFPDKEIDKKWYQIKHPHYASLKVILRWDEQDAAATNYAPCSRIHLLPITTSGAI
jgi:hypothetical protein